MKTAVLAALAALAACVAVASGEKVTVETVSPHSDDWELIGPADPTLPITLTIAVKQTHLRELEDALYAVSDPTSPLFGRHLSREEVHDIVTPKPESVLAVRRWLAAHGVVPDSTSPNHDFAVVTVPVAVAEALLGAPYFLWRHKSMTSVTALRLDATSYALDADVAPHVDFVRPSVTFPSVRRPFRVLDPDTPAALLDDPTFLRKLYNLEGVVSKNAGNKQAFASFLNQHFSASDLMEFDSIFMKNISAAKNVSKVLGPNSGLPGQEANLDNQYMMAMGAGALETWAYSTAGASPTNPENEPFLTWLLTMANETTVPYTVSVSYGDIEASVGYAYATRCNVEFQKLGLRGVSVMFASGDSGAGGNCSGTPGKFDPNWPADSPYVTAVGGTVGGTPGNSPTGETADYISGGGFSAFWPQPPYQRTAVEAYFKNNVTYMPPAKFYNRSGAGYPDVASQSEGLIIVWLGLPLPIAGTSCASPTFAGIVSLVNDVRLSAGKSPLGWLNPLIYSSAASSFNDVTEGVSAGCYGRRDTGFPATPGWDPVTGMGTINYQKFADVAVSLP